MLNTNRKLSVAIFCFLFFITLFFYFPARYAGFISDFIGYEQGYSRCGFLHFYNCGGMQSFRYAGHLFTYILFKTVGSDTLYWYVLYCFFHASAAFWGYVFINRLLKIYEVKNSFLPAFGAALLFLLSPYQAEVVVWKACIQYCFVCSALFLDCILLLSWSESPKLWKPFLSFFIFSIGMFSLEQAASIPIVLFCISLIIWWTDNKNAVKKSVLLFVVPQVLFIGFYFLLSKLVYHKWIMVYGASAYRDVISISTLARFFRYIAKYIFLARFFPEGTKEKIFSFIGNPYIVIGLTILSIIIFGKFIIDNLKTRRRSGIYLVFIALYIATLLPVIQQYDTTLLLSENDRLGYISSFFLFSILAVFLLERKNKILQVIYFVLLLVNLYFLVHIVHYWKQSNDMLYSYAGSFDFNKKEEVIVTAVPDNYKGILMIRTYGDNSGIEEFINYRLRKKIDSKIYEVASFNQANYNDGIKIKKENDSVLYVSFHQYGNWFWKGGIGLKNYENEKYKVEKDEWNGYHLYLKDIAHTHYTIVYPDSSRWKQFNF